MNARMQFVCWVIALIVQATMHCADATPLPCVADSLSTYVNAGVGCAIGGVSVHDFTYHPLSGAPLSSSLRVAPTSTGMGLTFSRADGTPLTASTGAPLQFEIDFDATALGAGITEADLALGRFTGIADVTGYGCHPSAYVFSGHCSTGTPDIVDIGSATRGIASLSFLVPISAVEWGLLFTVGGPTGSGSLDALSIDFAQVASIPEPDLLALLVAGSFVAWFVRRRTVVAIHMPLRWGRTDIGAL
jgi:hypothetical protein